MDIFSFIMLLGGLAFFLYGMTVLSSGLEKLAGGKLEKTLKRMTSSKANALLLGAGITIAIQSSSAMTVMLVGLVNSGIMELGQSIGLILGSNIGTTLTAWILALAGIDSDVIWLQFLKPENFSLVFALVGAIMIMMAKSRKRKDIGTILVGFAVLLYGMKLMSEAVSPLADMPEFASILTAFENPLLGVLVGAIFTGIIQSSAASVGVLQALSITGNITYGMGIPIIMGQNIGTCVTALLSSIGVNKSGRRVAVIHLTFNIVGTVVGLCVLMLVKILIQPAFLNTAMTPFGIALSHTIFNVIATLLFLPFFKQLESFAYKMVKGEDEKKEFVMIDENLFATPSLAISECANLTVNMAYIAYSSVMTAMGLIRDYSKKNAEEVMEQEDQLDTYEEKLGSYLVRLSSKDLTEADSKRAARLLRGIGDLERIGDHAINILESAQEMQEKKARFSPEGQKEVGIIFEALEEVLGMTVNAFATNDVQLALRVEPLEEVIDELVFDIRKNHIQRLQTGVCTIELGFILSDLLTNLERISDHCLNIAMTIIDGDKAGVSFHEYKKDMVVDGDESFDQEFQYFKEKYSLNKKAK